MAEEEPWALAKAAASPAPVEIAAQARAALHGSLFSLAASLFTIATCISPLLPKTGWKLLEQLGASPHDPDPRELYVLVGRRIDVGAPLFPKHESGTAEPKNHSRAAVD